MINVFLSPKQLFVELDSEKVSTWIPFGLLILINSFGIWWFYNGLSTEWIIEQQLAIASVGKTYREIEEARSAIALMAEMTGVIAVVGTLLMTLVSLSLIALYLMIVGNPGQKRTYGSWFSMSVWSCMPTVLNTFGLIALVMLSSDRDVPISIVNYLSINQLFTGLSYEHSWFSWAESFNIVYLWVATLFSIGLRVWSGYSHLRSAVLGFLPLVLFFGIWALIN